MPLSLGVALQHDEPKNGFYHLPGASEKERDPGLDTCLDTLDTCFLKDSIDGGVAKSGVLFYLAYRKEESHANAVGFI